jgi:ATP-binding cassette subfamily C (CFTR/MRP) protein 1
MSPGRLFTALSLLVLLAQPLFDLYDGLYAFMSAVGCIKRIETFLNLASRQENRIFSNNNLNGVKGLETVDSSLSPWASDRNSISIRGGNFGWNNAFQLRDINISVGSGNFVFLLGPVASGKTTLLKAILGETSQFGGSVELDTPEIAFCEQSPWLRVSLA